MYRGSKKLFSILLCSVFLFSNVLFSLGGESNLGKMLNLSDKAYADSSDGSITITCDNEYELYLNGVLVGTGNDWTKAQTYSLSLAPGKNVIAVKATNDGGYGSGNPGGLLAEVTNGDSKVGTNSTDWKMSKAAYGDSSWSGIAYDDSAWTAPTDYGSFGTGAWLFNVANMLSTTPAHWIWDSDIDYIAAPVYFRYTINNNVTVYPGSALQILEVQPGTVYELNTSDVEAILNRNVQITHMSMPEFISKVDEINGKYDIVYVGNASGLNGSTNYSTIGALSATLPEGGNSLEYYNGNDITHRAANNLKSFIDSKQLTIFADSIFTDPGLVNSKLNTDFNTSGVNNYRGNALKSNFVTIKDTNAIVSDPSTVNVGTKLSGTAFGTSPAWATGREYDKASDGDVTTYFDNASGSGGYTGIDLGAGNEKDITKIRFYPRDSYNTRMPGGKFQGSNTASDSGYTDLYTITNTPAADAWTEVTISDATKYRYLRYLGPDDSYGNIAEMEFYTEAVSNPAPAPSYTATKSLNDAISMYNSDSTIAKRPTINLIQQPLAYNGSTFQPSGSGLSYTYGLQNQNAATGDLMDVRLYIDRNGDGMFKDFSNITKSECVETQTNVSSSADITKGYVLTHAIPSDYTGLIPWKLEATDKATGAKSYITGASAFKGSQLNIRVLQLYPTGNSLDLTNSPNLAGFLKSPGEYNITISKMAVQDFDNSYQTDVQGNYINTPVQLNGVYDMVIFGFADCYSVGDLEQPKAIAALKDFINTNQSVMFTHDTMTYRNLDVGGWGYYLTKNFRDIIGQDVYLHDPLPDPNQTSYGYTTLTLDRANTGNFPYATYAHKLNDTLMTQYPFPLGDISVSTTHHQYFQLDMEDPQVVPIYTLSGTSFNSFDGRNDYYSYSKGNITYSGTGHSSPGGNIDELKLFVNTMIKAIKGANKAPTITVSNGLYDGINICNAQTNMNFTLNADDDNDRLLSGNIYIDRNDGKGYSVVKSFNASDTTALVSGIDTPISFVKSVDSSKTSFKIKIELTDSSNAMSSQEFTVNNVEGLTASADVEKGYLFGDTVTVPVDISLVKATTTSYSNVTLNITPDADYFDMVSTSSADLGTVTCGPGTSSTKLTTNVVLKMKNKERIVGNEGVTPFNLNLTYKDSGGNTINAANTFDFGIKSGVLKVQVVDSKNVALSNVAVSISSGQAGNVAFATGNTDANGYFTLNDVPTNTYNITVSAPDGYTGDSNKPYNMAYSVNDPEIAVFTLTKDPVYKNFVFNPSVISGSGGTKSLSTEVSFTLIRPVLAGTTITIGKSSDNILYPGESILNNSGDILASNLKINNADGNVSSNCTLTRTIKDSSLGYALTIPVALPAGNYYFDNIPFNLDFGGQTSLSVRLQANSLIVTEPNATSSDTYDLTNEFDSDINNGLTDGSGTTGGVGGSGGGSGGSGGQGQSQVAGNVVIPASIGLFDRQDDGAQSTTVINGSTVFVKVSFTTTNITQSVAFDFSSSVGIVGTTRFLSVQGIDNIPHDNAVSLPAGTYDAVIMVPVTGYGDNTSQYDLTMSGIVINSSQINAGDYGNKLTVNVIPPPPLN